MNYISALAVVLGIASGLISIYEFIKKGSWRPGVAYSAAAVILIVGAVVVANLPSPSGSQTSEVSSIQNSPTTSSGTGNTPAPTQATPTPTPTTVIATPSPAATLPCIVNVSAWPNESSWAAHDGSLYNDGTQNTTITAPCQIGTSNYAVEAKIQVTQQNCCYVSSTFGIFFSRAPGQNGWGMFTMGVGGDSSQCPNSAYISDTTNDICSNLLAAGPFSIGTSMHTYRAEVKDNTIRFFIDGGLVCTTTDNRLLTTQGDQAVGLYDSGNQLQVSSFEVTAL